MFLFKRFVGFVGEISFGSDGDGDGIGVGVRVSSRVGVGVGVEDGDGDGDGDDISSMGSKINFSLGDNFDFLFSLNVVFLKLVLFLL